MKSDCLLTRRPGSSREEFRRYYEEHHALLGMKHFAFEKYIRNHLVWASQDVDFDCISEFWQDTPAALAIMSSPIGEIFREDERRFMDRSKIRPCGATETLLTGPPRVVDPTPTLKRIVLVAAHPAVEANAFIEETAAWARGLLATGYGANRIMLDMTTSFPGTEAFPYAAIVSIWPTSGSENHAIGSGPPSAGRVVEVLAESHESPPSQLAALYSPA
jgi:hypothetical protein